MENKNKKTHPKGSTNVWAFWPAFIGLLILLFINIFYTDWMADVLNTLLYSMADNIGWIINLFGFYYPIREVIPIAIYHWNVGIVSRGKGKSAVAAAAYRSGEKITNEWDGMTHDYTRKGGVVHTEIMLPPHARPSFSDRSTLWNSVELYEKAGNAQLAREIDAALPVELSGNSSFGTLESTLSASTNSA